MNGYPVVILSDILCMCVVGVLTVVWYTINIDNTIDGESFSMTFPDE